MTKGPASEPVKLAPGPEPKTPSDRPHSEPFCVLVDVLDDGAGREAVGIGADVAARIQQRVMHEGVVHELGRFVVGRRVLVEEDEGVDLAGGEVQMSRALALTPSSQQRHLELVPGLGQDGEGVVGRRAAVSKAVVLGVLV